MKFLPVNVNMHFFPNMHVQKKMHVSTCMLTWDFFMLTWNFLHVNMPVNANMLFFPNMHVQKKMHVGMKWLTCWHGDFYVDMKFFACQHAIFSQHACSEKIACWHAKIFMSTWKSHVNMQVTCQHAAPFPDVYNSAQNGRLEVVNTLLEAGGPFGDADHGRRNQLCLVLSA